MAKKSVGIELPLGRMNVQPQPMEQPPSASKGDLEGAVPAPDWFIPKNPFKKLRDGK